MPQDKRGNNGDDGNVLVKVTVRRGNARAMGATPGTTVQSRRYISPTTVVMFPEVAPG